MRLPPSSPKPNERQRAKARAWLEAAGITTDEAAAPLLGGNWRPSPAPPLAEYIAHTLIVDKQTGKLIRFDLWDAQREALDFLVAHDFVVNVKGRQIGITWLVLALMSYEAEFGGNRAFPIGRQSEVDAMDAITRLMYLRGLDPQTGTPLPESPMPSEWRQDIASKTLTRIVLANGSSFHAKTATMSIGRGGAHYRGLADEYAFWPWQAAQRKALESGCARLDIVSSGNGEGDDFHAVWKKALNGEGIYRPLFVSATADPRRDAEWFRRHVDEDADPDGAAREYARQPEDAFRAPEGTYFKRFTRQNNVREFDVVPGWPTEVGIDWGLKHPAAVFLQISPNGQPQVYDEYLPVDEPRTLEFGYGILAKLSEYGVAKCRGPFADPAGKNREMQSRLSNFTILRDIGLRCEGIASKVVDGCVYMRESVGAEPGVPVEETSERLIVHPRCVGTIAALTNVKPHRNDPEVYDTDHETYSHPLDGLRYWHVNRYRKRKTRGGGIAWQ